MTQSTVKDCLFALIKIVVAQPPVERGGRNAEDFRSFAAMPARLFERGEDLLSFDFAQGCGCGVHSGEADAPSPELCGDALTITGTGRFARRTNSGGSSFNVMRPSFARSSARSRQLRSWRTLPGQS